MSKNTSNKYTNLQQKCEYVGVYIINKDQSKTNENLPKRNNPVSSADVVVVGISW